MAFMQQIMTSAMNNPTVLLIGLGAGFLLGKQMQKRKMRKQNSMGMGMGM